MKKTLVLGASPNPSRYSNMAVHLLRKKGHPVIAIGLRQGIISDVTIEKGQPIHKNIDTLTLYLGPKNQVAQYEYILSLKPKRIIFNPGTENEELMNLAEDAGIKTEDACTLVLLRLGSY